MKKPDWKNAPEWADYLMATHIGSWVWLECKPTFDGKHWIQHGKAEEIEHPDYQATLEARPIPDCDTCENKFNMCDRCIYQGKSLKRDHYKGK